MTISLFSRKQLVRLGLLAATVAAILVGAALFSAFEAHVINVTARIENALRVNTNPIDFGTVFPQEYLTSDVQVVMSDSFRAENRADDIEYVIKQKPKVKAPCIDIIPNPTGITGLFGIKLAHAQTGPCADPNEDPKPGDPYANIQVDGFEGPAWKYCEENLPPDSDLTDGIGYTVNLQDPYWQHCYLPLANSLSKHELTEDGRDPQGIAQENDTSVEAFHQAYFWDAQGSHLVLANIAKGRLAKSEGDPRDLWQIDLKVPCFFNHCAQEAFNPDNQDPFQNPNDTIPGFYVPTQFQLDPKTEHSVFGTDLWIEVTEISRVVAH